MLEALYFYTDCPFVRAYFCAFVRGVVSAISLVCIGGFFPNFHFWDKYERIRFVSAGQRSRSPSGCIELSAVR